MPFREAHHVTGRIVGLASDREIGLEELALEDMQAIEPRITPAVFDVLGVDASVRSRTSYGGTAPENVRAQAELWLARLGNSGRQVRARVLRGRARPPPEAVFMWAARR